MHDRDRAAVNSSADILFINGQVVTMAPNGTVVEALATKGDRILAIGSTSELTALKGAATRVVDLQGRTLLPGLIDSHCHLALYGMYLSGVDCRYPAVESIKDIQEKIRAAASLTSSGAWIRGWAYDHKKLKEGRHPTRWELDEVAPDHPVHLVRTDYHISVANSRALEIAGITADTPDPKGGRIQRDAKGEPNGVLVDAAHMDMGHWSALTEEELIQALIAASDGYLSYGVTSVHDAGGPAPVQIPAALEARRRGELRVRIYMLLWTPNNLEAMHESFLGTRVGTGFGDDFLRVGHFKLMVDGSSSGPTAAMREPYDSNPEDAGLLYYTQEEVTERFRKAFRSGYQLTAHGMGDRGIDIVMNGIEAALAEADELSLRSHYPPRIEHCGFVDPEMIHRIKRLGIIPVPQSTFLYDFGDGYLRDYGDRTRYMFACRTFIDQGITVAGSSDCPVTSPDPMLGIYAAMTRKTQGGQLIGPEEAITLREALQMYTINGARASGEEDRKGSLEPGKLADLAVLSEPLLDLDVETIKDVKAVMTVIAGQVVFERQELQENEERCINA
jgi:predicted amidohydrolase YtcJ